MSSYNKQRLDTCVHRQGYSQTRSQAGHLIRLGHVKVNGAIIKKPGHMVSPQDKVRVSKQQQYVSRAGLKLDSVAELFAVSFQDAVVLDVGSSTGGFTDYALQHGARKVIAVDVGTNQLHHSLRGHPKIELHERTDIRDFSTGEPVDIVLIDVSFISQTKLLPHIKRLIQSDTDILSMVKPQFESGSASQLRGGVVKNNRLRRQILQNFEQAVRQDYKIIASRDASVAGERGNIERFYHLRAIQQ